MNKIVAATLLLSVMMTGCNTVKGVGQDISKVGQGIKHTADQTQDQQKKK